MPTGLGSRKVLTPKSSKVPRRSLPPQAKLIEAASFDSVEGIPSSPDIMTQKLQEKVREKKQHQQHQGNHNTSKKSSNSSSSSSTLHQRLKAAASSSSSSNSLASNSGRSKLSTEEFKLSDDYEETSSTILNDKYNHGKKNEILRSSEKSVNLVKNGSSNDSNNYRSSSYNSHNNSNSNNNTSSSNYSSNNNNSSSNYKSTNDYTSTNSQFKPSSSSANTSGYNPMSNTSGYNTSSITSNTGSVSSRPYGYSSTGVGVAGNSTNLSNNSFDRWNSSIGNPVESIELLKDQLSHQQRDYESLKQRFNELSRLRFSEPEEQLEEHKKLSDLRDQEAQKVIKSLLKEKEEILEQFERLKLDFKDVNINNSVSKPSNESGNEDQDIMNEVEKVLKIYSSFSGLKITPIPSDPLNQWHCEFKSRSGQFEFELTYESSLNRYQYLPLPPSSSGTIKDLPQFLASDILITSDQMQLFFWRLLDTLSKRKD